MSNRLPTLKDEAHAAHADSLRHVAAFAEKALAAGAALTEAKALCAHGTWAAWLADTGIPERSAQRYMKLHRAGCKSAMVADMGIARAERIAALGLSLWPSGETGREMLGADRDGAFCYALIVPDAEGRAFYRAAYLFPDSAQDFWTAKRCGLPFALGILQDHVTTAFDFYIEREMTADETRAAVAEMEGAA